MTTQGVLLVLVNLLIFTVFHITLFTILELTPDQTPNIWESCIYLIVMIPISLGIGLLTAMYDKQGKTPVSLKITTTILLAISLLSLMQEGSKWSQLLTIFTLLPIMYGGVWCYKRYFATDRDKLPFA